jgi:hypothetical protein
MKRISDHACDRKYVEDSISWTRGPKKSRELILLYCKMCPEGSFKTGNHSMACLVVHAKFHNVQAKQ